MYGDGVNIAARLEGLAQPGGIAVSAAVQVAQRDRLTVAFRDLGEHSVKNIARPVRAFQLQLEGAGRMNEAAAELERMQAAYPDLTISKLIKAMVFSPPTLEKMTANLRKAGVPE